MSRFNEQNEPLNEVARPLSKYSPRFLPFTAYVVAVCSIFMTILLSIEVFIGHDLVVIYATIATFPVAAFLLVRIASFEDRRHQIGMRPGSDNITQFYTEGQLHLARLVKERGEEDFLEKLIPPPWKKLAGDDSYSRIGLDVINMRLNEIYSRLGPPIASDRK